MTPERFRRKQLIYLSKLLKTTPEKIEEVTNSIESYYGNIEAHKWNADGTLKKYANGDEKIRIINPAYGDLNKIQESIKANILKKFHYPSHLHGGVPRRSNVTNARVHKGNKYFFTSDISNCYPSISNDMVNNAFKKELKFTNITASILTKLTTLNYSLPQGTSTSPFLANICLLPMDREILKLIEGTGVRYTRYVDDMAFSSSKDFKELIPLIIEVIQKSGINISRRKTEYGTWANITGIVVNNNYIDAPEELKEKSKKLTASNNPYLPYFKQIKKVNKQKLKV